MVGAVSQGVRSRRLCSAEACGPGRCLPAEWATTGVWCRLLCTNVPPRPEEENSVEANTQGPPVTHLCTRTDTETGQRHRQPVSGMEQAHHPVERVTKNNTNNSTHMKPHDRMKGAASSNTQHTTTHPTRNR